MAIVNQRISGKPVAKPVPKQTSKAEIDRIAKEILNTKHNYGTGATRVARLGKDYAAVQARINEILAGKSSAPTPIKVGDRVVVKSGARDYNGGRVIPQWYTTTKVVSSLRGDRAVLDSGGWNTPFNVKDLIKK